MPFLYPKRTQEEHAQALADYHPNCRIFESKNIDNSNLRRLIRGLSVELWRFENTLNDTVNDYDIRNTTNLIEEWEKLVGIPDDCFDNTGSIEQRRENVLIKFGSLFIQTERDFIDLAALFGFTITISHASEIGNVFPLKFPFTFFGSLKTIRFTLLVNLDNSLFPDRFPMIFPFKFAEDNVTIMECLFNKLKPANVQLIFRFI